MSDVTAEITALLNKIAVKEGFQKYSLFLLEKLKKPDVNSTGDLFFYKIKEQNGTNKRELFIKKSSEIPSVRLYYPIAGMYLNESQFYLNIWSTFLKLQQCSHNILIENEIPKCYGTDMTPSKEVIVLENLNANNFHTIEFSRFLDKRYYELIFDRYGKFHALSLAYKSKFPNVFDEMAKGLFDYWGCLHKLKNIEKSVTTMFHECQQYLLEETDKNMVEKFQEYVNRGHVGFSQSAKYTGVYPVILHGDSSTNNMMFKYDKNKKPIEMKFIDFQIVRLGTLVFDLSYCLYSSAKSEVFEELDHLLKVYYDAFSRTLRKFESDYANLYSFKVLKEEWKTYSKFGFIMGLLQIRNKCTREEIPKVVADAIDNPMDRKVWKMDTEEAKKLSLGLIKHMYKRGFL